MALVVGIDALGINRHVPPFGIGCWQAGGLHFNRGRSIGWQDVDQDELVAAYHAALEAGINLFDTADSYGPDLASVRRLARLTRGLSRDDYRLAIKIGYDESTQSLRWEHVGPRLKHVLDILGSPHCELFSLHHNGRTAQDYDAVVDSLLQARRSGLALSVAVRIGHVPTYLEGATPSRRELAERDLAIARETSADALLMNHALERPPAMARVPLFCNKALAQGRYFKQPGDVFAAGDTRMLDDGFHPSSIERVAALREHHNVNNEDLLRHAIHSAVNVADRRFAYFGVRTVRHVREIVAAWTRGPLPPTQAERIVAFLCAANPPTHPSRNADQP